MNNKRTDQKLTRTPAPFLPGYYSVQAMSVTPGLPDVTVYRNSAEEAIEWKDKQVTAGRFSRYLLRSSTNAWDVFNAKGALEFLCENVIYDHMGEADKPVKINREQFDASVADVMGEGLTCVACAECHSGASSVEHSNFVVLSRVITLEASATDLDHIYVAESHDFDCRVVGLFMRLGKMSKEATDKYLDRYKWLSEGWPLSNPHHAGILAARMAKIRGRYLSELVCHALAQAGGDIEDQAQAKFQIMSVRDDQRYTLARKVVDALLPGLEIEHPGGVESFTADIQREKAAEVAAAYKALVPI